MKLRFRYRLYPTKQQEELFKSFGGASRFLYNQFLWFNIGWYNTYKKFLWKNDMCKILVEMKTYFPWLTEIHSQVLQQAVGDLEQALKNMKHGSGFPQYKSKASTPYSFRYPQGVYIRNNTHVYLPKIGLVKIKLHRPLVSYKSCTIIQTARGWYISFVTDRDEQKQKCDINTSVGVDVNSQYTALSTCELIKNPRPLFKKRQRIKTLQRKLARKQKGSKNREKTRKLLARVHDQIHCQRKDHIHQMSARIAKGHDLVSVETLRLDKMRRKSKLVAKAIADAGWGMLIQAIAYKCQLYGNHFVQINEWLPSSKTCHKCGHKKNDFPLDIREYDCEKCGMVMHRDVNAAINIDNYGRQQWNLDHARQELPEAPVNLVVDVLVNCGESTATDTKQEAVAL